MLTPSPRSSQPRPSRFPRTASLRREPTKAPRSAVADVPPVEVAAFYLEWLQRFLCTSQGMAKRDLTAPFARGLRPAGGPPVGPVLPLLLYLQAEGLATWRAWLPRVTFDTPSGRSLVPPLQDLLRRTEATVGKHIGAVASRMALFSTAREVTLGREEWVRDLGLIEGLVEG